MLTNPNPNPKSDTCSALVGKSFIEDSFLHGYVGGLYEVQTMCVQWIQDL